ncbi:MAG: enolase C-terminal domain-like protein, partial [Alphaproteobacteria bacterium]
HVELRRAMPNQTYATGEHWTTVAPFKWALDHDLADVYQPDILWCGGMTVAMEIARLAAARGKQVILHNGGRGPFGPQFSFASPTTPWLEYYIDAAPGVSLEDAGRVPGRRIPEGGWLTPCHKPGFGIEIDQSWLAPY